MKAILMNTRARRTTLAVVLAATFTIIPAFAGGQGGGPADVVVTNTSAQPVPVTVMNQQAAPSSVTVNNTAAQPVPMQDRNNGAYQPYYLGVPVAIPSGGTASVDSPVVPAGKRLVIETISASALVNNSVGTTPHVRLDSSYNLDYGNYALYLEVPMTYTGPSGPTMTTWSGTQSARLYVEPGKSFKITAVKSTDMNGNYSGTASTYVTIIGHYIDIP